MKEGMREICVPFVNLKHHIFMTYDLLVIFEDYNNKTISPILYIFTLSLSPHFMRRFLTRELFNKEILGTLHLFCFIHSIES